MSTILENSKTDKKSAHQEKKTALSGERDNMIAEAAYYHAEKREFKRGKSKQDWYKAEKELELGYTWE